jgi:TolA-binding protein
MRRFWFLVLICPFLYGSEGDEEALFLRRIADFWQEKEYQLAKNQMEEFIVSYPESPYSDALCAALGDLYLREKNHSHAISFYTRIQSPEFYHRVFLNRMQCLYEMQWYATLADECESYLENGENLHVTYFLAIALYHQCLNSTKDPEGLLKLAERAKPYFETLSKSELSNEVAQGFAHLSCILKDFPKAAEIYSDLAKKDPESQEEMLFQVGLIQSQFDKERALDTFEQIVQLGQKKAKEAAYNRLVLAFDLGKYEAVAKENFIDELPPERVAMARLFLGRSLLNMKKYDAAVNELRSYVQEAAVSDTLHAAIINLLEASYQSDDLASLDYAIGKLVAVYANDAELPKAYFSRAQLLKKGQQFEAAKKQLEELLAQFPEFQYRPQVVFELTHLDYKAKAWDECHKKALAFLAEFPEHELSSFAWRYCISSSAEMAIEHPELRKKLIGDLETYLKLTIADSERQEWELLLAKTHYELQEYEKAMTLLQNLDSPNAHLLLSLCYRDGYSDLAHFCEIAETALSQGANLIAPGQIHTSLFNAYVELGEMNKGADHLYAAFQANADIKIENLLWLADVYLARLELEQNNFVLAHRAALILDKCKAAIQNPKNDAFSGTPIEECKAALHDSEEIVCKLAKVYSILGRTDDEIALLESLSSLSPEAQLLLAEGYARKGIVEKATQMFDEIVSSCATVRTPISASASLQAARLKLVGENPDLAKIATQLKSLVVQKTFEGAPTYLEAALDYVEVQAKTDLAKKVALLQKTKVDFESRDDLLSKDYHEARSRWPQKDKIYQGYLQLIDAEVLASRAKLEPQNQKELRAKSKDLLLKIVNEQSATALLQRARMLLTSVDEPKAKT